MQGEDINTRLFDARFAKNQNALQVNVGMTGTGKSYAGLRVYEKQMVKRGRVPTINDIAVGDGKEFLEIVSRGLPSKYTVLFDEAGLGLPAREFQSIINKVLGYILEIFRRDQIAVIFTVPDFYFLDIKARKLMHYYCEMLDPSLTGGFFGYAKFMRIVNSPRGDGIHFAYPKVFVNGKSMYARPSAGKQGNIRYMMPSDEKLIADYESKKKVFVDGMKEQAIKQLQKAQRRMVNAKELADIMLQDPYNFGFGFLRVYEGLPSTKSIRYLRLKIKSQFENDERYTPINPILSTDIIEQAIVMSMDQLNPKDLEIMQLKQQGFSTAEIGSRAGIDRSTVYNIYKRLNIATSDKGKSDGNDDS